MQLRSPFSSFSVSFSCLSRVLMRPLARGALVVGVVAGGGSGGG